MCRFEIKSRNSTPGVSILSKIRKENPINVIAVVLVICAVMVLFYLAESYLEKRRDQNKLINSFMMVEDVNVMLDNPGENLKEIEKSPTLDQTNQ